MKEIFRFVGRWLLMFHLGVGSPLLAKKVELGEPPANHVWDRDNLFRDDPEMIKAISRALKSVDEEYGMRVYLVTHSDVIAEKPAPFAMRCQDVWLGEKSEGLFFVLSLNGGVQGVVGYSANLYNGHFFENGMMSRLPYSDLQSVVEKGLVELMKKEEQVEKVHVYSLTVVDELKKRLSRQEKKDHGEEEEALMGWMALALIACGMLIAFVSKLDGSAERRSRRTYHFPEFTVPQRLKASNGGGKISLIDFGIPPSSDGR